MGGLRSSVAVLAGSILLLAVPAGANATTIVPAGFVGMNANGPLFSAAGHPQRELDRMVANGVESIRVVFNWSAAQPYPNWNAVPFGQVGNYQPYPVPTSFTETDRVVELAARRHLTVLPVVLYAPYWDQRPHPAGTIGIPSSRGALCELPSSASPPIRATRQLLATASRTHEGADPDVADLERAERPRTTGRRSNGPQLHQPAAACPRRDQEGGSGCKGRAGRNAELRLEDLGTFYKGARTGLFDAVAVHPYTKLPRGVITILTLVRRVMDAAGDRRKPIILTELNWPSALHRTPFGADYETTAAGQARRLAEVLPLLAP